MCGKRLRSFLCGLVALSLLWPLSCFSVELSEEEWMTVKDSYQTLNLITKERDSLAKDKETLQKNNEVILRDNETLLKDNLKLSIENENLTKENENLTRENEEHLKDLEKSLRVSKLEETLKIIKWCALTALLTAAGVTIYNMNT